MADQPQVILEIILVSSWVVETPYVHELTRGIDNHTAAIAIVWQRRRRACDRGTAPIHPPSPQMGSLPTANGDPVTAVSAPVGGSMLNPKIALVSGDLDERVGQDAAVDTGGSYSDGTTKFLTQSGTWSSSATSVATVSAVLVTSVNYGTTTITASYGGPKAPATLTVQSPALVSITISPTAYTIASGTAVQFHTTGNYSDNSTLDITNRVTWSTSDSTIATVSNTSGSQGAGHWGKPGHGDDHGDAERVEWDGEFDGAMMSAPSLLSTRRHVQRYECCSRQPEPKAMVSGVSHSHAGSTSQGRAGLGLGDLATDKVFTDEALARRAAITGGVQLSAVKTVFRALKNVFEPMLLGPAAVPTRMPAQASLIVLPLMTLFVTGPQLLSTRIADSSLPLILLLCTVFELLQSSIPSKI